MALEPFMGSRAIDDEFFPFIPIYCYSLSILSFSSYTHKKTTNLSSVHSCV